MGCAGHTVTCGHPQDSDHMLVRSSVSEKEKENRLLEFVNYWQSSCHRPGWPLQVWDLVQEAVEQMMKQFLDFLSSREK